MNAEEIARQAARGFEVFQCVECSANIRQALVAAGCRGQLLELQSRRGDFMLCLSFDGGKTTITQTGKHLGIRVGDVVFDNLHPDGMLFEDWRRDFDAIGGVELREVIDF